MSNKPNNPSAFPVPNNVINRQGMTLRDYFAAKAMQGICAFSGSEGTNGSPHAIAGRSYEIADAMLKAREL